MLKINWGEKFKKRKLFESVSCFYNLFVRLSYKCLFQGGHSFFFLLQFFPLFPSNLFQNFLLQHPFSHCASNQFGNVLIFNNFFYFFTGFYFNIFFYKVKSIDKQFYFINYPTLSLCFISAFSFSKSILLLCIKSIYKQPIESNSTGAQYRSSISVDFFLFSENLEVIMPPSASKVIVQFSVKSVFDCFQNVNENFKKKSRKHPLKRWK